MTGYIVEKNPWIRRTNCLFTFRNLPPSHSLSLSLSLLLSFSLTSFLLLPLSPGPPPISLYLCYSIFLSLRHKLLNSTKLWFYFWIGVLHSFTLMFVKSVFKSSHPSMLPYVQLECILTSKRVLRLLFWFWETIICCVFWPANWCSAHLSLVEKKIFTYIMCI